jgi:hypothetical protein
MPQVPDRPPLRAMLPFTTREFLSVFAAYNEAMWPAAIVAYLLAGIAVFAIARPSPTGEKGMIIFLAAMWAWTGIAYHWLFFSTINKAAFVFGAAFVVQAALLLCAAVRRERMALRFSADLSGVVGAMLIAYAAILYPLIGWLSGHSYPSAPMFGIAPCPVTIFTFGVCLLARGRVPWWLLVIPVLWSLIGGSAAFLLRVPQDWLLLVSGVSTVLLRLFGRRKGSASALASAEAPWSTG